MQKVYNNILDLKDQFDVFIFDAYGVFWDGTKFFQGSRESMEKLVQEGKTVYVLSNTTQVCSVATQKYAEKGLLKGIHFNELITSGEFCRYKLLNNEINFKAKTNAKKVFVFGKKNGQLFENTEYKETENISDADFVYLSAVFISPSEYLELKDKYDDYLVQIRKSKDGSYRITEIEPIISKIENIIVNSNLPVLTCNPDYKAFEGIIGSDVPCSIITQGSIAKYLRERNVEVLEFGKPYKEIYDFVFDSLRKSGIIADKSRICMVGDTLRTDIKGANNSDIKSVLCVETGITANELKNGKDLEALQKSENVKIDYMIKGL